MPETGTSWAFFSASRSFSAKIRDTALVTISKWETMAKPWENMEKPPKKKGLLEVGPKAAARSPSNLDLAPPGCPRRWAGAFHPCCRWPVSPGQYGPYRNQLTGSHRGTSRSYTIPLVMGFWRYQWIPHVNTPLPHSSLAFWVRDFSNHFVLGHLQCSPQILHLYLYNV